MSTKKLKAIFEILNNQPLIKKCINCGKNFRSTNPSQKICSEKCKKERTKSLHQNQISLVKKCIVCGKTFKASGKEKICSYYCRRKRANTTYSYKNKIKKMIKNNIPIKNI